MWTRSRSGASPLKRWADPNQGELSRTPARMAQQEAESEGRLGDFPLLKHLCGPFIKNL